MGTTPSGASIETLFRCPILQLLSETEARPFALHAFGNNRFQCLLKRPTRKPLKLHSVQPAQAPVAPRSLDLEAISLGDAKIEKAVNQAQRLLEKDIPLLIHGETGVGKEVFVKALHQASTRATQPLIAVNCAAIPAELVEAELFGYERGAFTGASQKGSIGLIRKANKGTLFLDEVGDMPLPVQARLLRGLQERCVQPLGSSELYPVDIRLISATNRSLRDQVQTGHFRQDLYYRISGLNIELPPLRERTDKHALIQRIWERHRDAHQRAGFSREVLELFEHHPWPGNIRQLNSVIQVALALADEQPISTEHLPEDFLLDMGMDEDCREPVKTQESTVRLHTTEDLSQLFQAAGGNISQLAKRLGVSRNTLYKRLREQRIV
ncbi:Sigma-54 dependent transcriptional regulator [Pseudomonas savastanoi]|nr:Sigma-54 dependent transcriptional regulator [Pseudomonas savastanoi]KPY72219.1 Transcriptional activator of acetoin/glycerol metabolism [Pseudomonas savastanoi pv. savastanoi]